MTAAKPKVWFITGTSRGLGRAIAEAALESGASVVATAREPADLVSLKQQWNDRLLPFQLDVTDPAQAKEAVDAAVRQFGRIDVVVNNAGKADLASIEDVDLASFREQLETVFMGVVNVTKAALPILRQQRSGHFIQVSSVGGRLATPGMAAYQSAKRAVTGFSLTLAAEVEPLGLRVSILEPGTMRTDMPGGRSMEISNVSEPYMPTVGKVRDRIKGSFEHAPNDPHDVAGRVVQIALMSDPPLRALLGADAFEYGQAAVKVLMDADERWEKLGVTQPPSAFCRP